MPLDEGGAEGAEGYKPKKKKKSDSVVVTGEQVYGGSKAKQPKTLLPAEIPDRDPNIGAVWGPGVNNIFDLNRRAELASYAYQANFGTEPSPGLLFDLIRSDLPDDQFEGMLKIPLSFAQARAQAEAQHERLGSFEEEFQQAKKDYAEGKLTPEEFHRAENEFERIRGEAQGKAFPEPSKVEEMGFGVPVLAAQQITQALAYSPAGVYELGKTLGYDALAAAPGTAGSPTFERSRKMGEEIVKSVKETYTDPLANPGYVLMDILGLAAGGAGAVSRVSRASRVARAGEGPRAVFNALARRGLPGTDEVGGEDRLLSQNVAAAVVQRALNERRRRALEKRRGVEPTPYEPLPERIPIIDRFRTEATVGREAAARLRTERSIALEPVRELRALTGWAINSAKAFERMPRAMRRGLSRGEQKAIQVLFLDHPGTWEDKIQVMRELHEAAISEGWGARKAHERQLADLALAEQALKQNRSRFQKAVAFADEVSLEGELLKIAELGLDPKDAASRIARMGQTFRRETLEDDAVPLTDTARYIPSQRTGKARSISGAAPGLIRPGRYGIPPPRKLPELTHHFDGKSVIAGDFRIDAANLIAESYANAVRAVFKKKEHSRLWDLSTEKKMSEWDEPIRSWESIPDELRQIRDADFSGEGALTKKQLEKLGDKQQKAMLEWLYPETSVEGSRWVDSRYHADTWRYPNEPSSVDKFFSAFNEPLRATTLFLRPAYGVGNVLGNTGMLLMQSLGAPNNIRKAYQINKRYGEKNARTIADLVSEGKSLSFAPDDLVQTKISRTLAHAWNALVDRKFREASFIHWAERKGYNDEASMTRLLDMRSKDKQILKDRNEITRRAKKDMVEFDNLTPFEKNHLRHYIFVYPWVSRSIVWGLRTMIEHPLKTWSLVQLGKEGEEEAEKAIAEFQGFAEARVPDWVTASGYFPLYTDDNGTPKLVNPSSFNTFSGLNEMLRTGQSLTSNVPYAGPEEYSSPALDWVMRFVNGRNSYGTEYENRILDSAVETLENLPQAQAFKKAIGKERKIPEDAPPDERPSFKKEGWLEYIAPLVAGGAWPRTPDAEALASDFTRDLPADTRKALKVEERAEAIRKRLALEQQLIKQAEQINSQIIGKPLPQEVREALDFQIKYAKVAAEIALRDPFEKDGSVKSISDAEGITESGSGSMAAIGRTLTGLESRLVQIRLLKDMGRISEAEMSTLVTEANKAADKGEITSWGNQFDKDYLGADELADWYDARDAILDFASNAQSYLSDLRKQGLYKGGSGPAPQEDLFAVGRQYLAYSREKTVREEDTGGRSDLVTIDNALDRAWQDSQDKPIKIDGKVYPSPARIEWATKTDEERLNSISDWTVASWNTLSDFEKELVGKKPAEGTSKGWAILQTAMDSLRGNLSLEDVPKDFREFVTEPLALDERTISAEYKNKLARWVDKNYAPGFYRDFLFALEPKFSRLSSLPVIYKSEAADEWKEVLGAAKEQFAYIKKSRERDYKVPYTITSVQERWADYAVNTLWPYIREHGSQTFIQELRLLSDDKPEDLLKSLIADGTA